MKPMSPALTGRFSTTGPAGKSHIYSYIFVCVGSFLFLINLSIFNWRIIALQYYIGFCHTSTWISHRYPYVPSFLNLSPSYLLPYPAPLCCHRVPYLTSLCHTANSYWLSVLYMVMRTFPYYSLNSSHPLLPPLYPAVCFLCLCFHCCPADRFISTIFLDSI